MRAPGLQQGDPSWEVIELLDDDTDAFGLRVPAPTTDRGGPRWAAPVAGLALAGAIAYAVISSASPSRPPDAAVVPSTTAPPTTVPAPTTTDFPTPTVPYFAAEPPLGYALMGADDSTTSPGFRGGSGYQLWVPTGRSPAETWFSINTWGGGGFVFSAVNAYRVDVAGRSIAIGHRSGGVTTADFSIDNKLGVTLTSVGLSDGAVVRVASSIVDTGGQVVLSYPALMDGFQRISTVQPLFAIQRSPAVHAYYAKLDDPREYFTINVAPLDFAADAASDESRDRAIALEYGLSRATSFSVGDHAAVAGSMVDQPDVSLASWLTGDSVVTVTGKLTVSQLVAIARTVHEVPASDWKAMKRQAAANLLEANRSLPFEEQPSQPVAFGTDANGTPWTVRVANASFGEQPQLAWHWSGLNATTDPSNAAQIHVFLDHDQTFVVADVPRAIT
ncbi:MAG TPA: hypothetical protein VLD86_07810, partial [Ilumatobacteraceae bacterium]|nr:hypothetical protein [Ilumatobacteraceae bacterium]